MPWQEARGEGEGEKGGGREERKEREIEREGQEMITYQPLSTHTQCEYEREHPTRFNV